MAGSSPAMTSLFIFRSLAQAVGAEAILAGNRHWQPHGLVLAPARTFRIAVEFGPAAGTGKTAEREAFCPICHEGLSNRAVFFMPGSSRTAV